MTSKLPKGRNILAAATVLLFIACSKNESKPAASYSVAGLQNIIKIEFPIKSARWDIFGTPEYTGGVPGPTDYMTLVAELEPEQDSFDGKNVRTGTTFITPEAARPWLTDYFRELLDKNKNSMVDLSKQGNCRIYSTTIKKSGRPVSGFLCKRSSRILMYLTLSSPAG